MPKNLQNALSYTPTSKLPILKKLKTSWDLKSHFYVSEKDPRIEKDMRKAEQIVTTFEKKYRGKDFTSTAHLLLRVLHDYEHLLASPELRRPTHYFEFRRVLNTKDSVAEKAGNLASDRMTKAGNKLLFFEIAIGKIPKDLQKKYLVEPTLSHFAYYLARIFIEAKYTLTEAEERIINLKSGPSSEMWVAGTEKILSNRTVTHNGNTMALPEALERIETLMPEEKRGLWSLILDEIEDISEVAENEFNAIITNKKISDELRGHKKPYSATVLSYENEEKSVENLIDVVSMKGFALSKKFYKLKAKIHGEKTIPYVNKYDPIAPQIPITYEDAVTICRDAFYGTKEEYGRFFDNMITGGNLDVYPKKGKRGGAFMSSDIGLPTFVFLNHTDTFKSLETLAHEMGHALHSNRSKSQRPIYEHYSTTTAETASTLFENIVFNHILSQASPDMEKVLLHDRITRDIATIQRQIAFYNFELELHTAVRKNGAVTKEELQEMMQRHLESYLGPAVDVTKRDGLSYVYVPHFRYGFYVYSYTYGILMSSMMANNLANDPQYIEKIDLFLSSGGSNTVENIFKSIDINTRKQETFERSLQTLENDITHFEKLIQRKT